MLRRVHLYINLQSFKGRMALLYTGYSNPLNNWDQCYVEIKKKAKGTFHDADANCLASHQSCCTCCDFKRVPGLWSQSSGDQLEFLSLGWPFTINGLLRWWHFCLR